MCVSLNAAIDKKALFMFILKIVQIHQFSNQNIEAGRSPLIYKCFGLPEMLVEDVHQLERRIHYMELQCQAE